jgi:hypothetical protein
MGPTVAAGPRHRCLAMPPLPVPPPLARPRLPDRPCGRPTDTRTPEVAPTSASGGNGRSCCVGVRVQRTSTALNTGGRPSLETARHASASPPTDAPAIATHARLALRGHAAKSSVRVAKTFSALQHNNSGGKCPASTHTTDSMHQLGLPWTATVIQATRPFRG